MTKPKPVRTCPHCHSEFTRYDKLGFAAFAIIGHCGSKACMEAAKAKGRSSVKPCEVCGCAVHKRRREAWKDFEGRKTCGSSKCMKEIYARRSLARRIKRISTKKTGELYPYPEPSPVTAAILGLR